MKAQLKSEAMAAEAEAQRLKTVHEAAAEVRRCVVMCRVVLGESFGTTVTIVCA